MSTDRTGGAGVIEMGSKELYSLEEEAVEVSSAIS